MTAAQGTIPALPQYQPGALPLGTTVFFEIVDSYANYTSAASWAIALQDLVGKAPSVMNYAVPTASDKIAFYQNSSGLPVQCNVGDVGGTFGNLPAGGATGTLLVKSQATNYAATWTSIASLISASTSMTVTGSTTLALSVATNGVGNAQFRQGSPMSVVGVTANATANVADIIASGAGMVLQSNATSIFFAAPSFAITTSQLPGPYQTGTLATAAILIGNGQNPITAVGPLSAGQLLVGVNVTTNPAAVTMSGDGTITSTGVINITKTNGSVFAASATTNALNASNINSGVLASTFGGAGAINGLLKAAGTGVVATAVPGTDFLNLTQSAILSTGFGFNAYSVGVLATTTFTVSPYSGNYQFLTCNGAFTFAAPTVDGAIDCLITMSTAANAIAFSGFTVNTTNVGDAITTTSTNKFIISVRRINGVSTYVAKALQ